MTLQPHGPNSTNSATDVTGSVTPRLWTPPLRELTEATSYGWEVIDFAARIGWPLDPWEKWAIIHAGELLEDGRPRFRIVLILVARQNGKTLLSRVWILWWLFVSREPLVLAAHADRDKAKQSWSKVIEMAQRTPLLARELGRRPVVKQVGEEDFSTLAGAHFRFGAANRRLGRGDTVHRLNLDELREHLDWDAYDAAVNAGNAVKDFQAVMITNQGDERAVVLDSLRESALEFIETGHGDSRLGLFEWSAPDGAEPDDPAALAMANPNVGRRLEMDVLIGAGRRAKRRGGEQLARFRTEVLCMRQQLLDPAIDPDRWRDAGYDVEEHRVDLAEHRRQVALCLDVAIDGSHATLVAAARVGEHIYVEVVRRWQGYGCTKAVRAELPALVGRLRPRTFGWFPEGPAAAVAAALRTKQAGRVWPPPRVEVAELQAETAAVCMGLAEQVATDEIRHPRDPMLDQHVGQTQKLRRGESRWIYTRAGSKPIDATYAMAGAVHLARTLPPPLPPLAAV